MLPPPTPVSFYLLYYSPILATHARFQMGLFMKLFNNVKCPSACKLNKISSEADSKDVGKLQRINR